MKDMVVVTNYYIFIITKKHIVFKIAWVIVELAWGIVFCSGLIHGLEIYH